MPLSLKNKLSLGALDERLGFHLRVAQVRLFKDFEKATEALGLTPAVFSTLEVLRENPGITQSSLAGAIYLERSSVVPLLDKLEQRGLIVRKPSASDRRHNHLFLTGEGEALYLAATTQVNEHEERVSAKLTPQERSALLQLLKKVAR